MISDDVACFIRRMVGPVFIFRGADRAAIAVDAATDTLKFYGSATKEVMDLSSTQTATAAKTFTGAVAFTGATTGVRSPAVITTADTVSPAAADSGTVYICTKSSATQIFTLPAAAAAAGLTYSFVCGHASGEIQVGVATGDAILGKIHASNDGTALASTASTGLLKNTAATNVIGDACTLVSDGVSLWYMVAELGVWSAT